jgi:N,N'-diacetyllegionaminate synthase
MFLFGKDLSSEIVVVAEVGVNHGGSVQWILDFLPKIKEAGVDAVKFQLFTPKYHTTKANQSRFSFLEKVYLSENAFDQILESCKQLNLSCFATPVTPDWVHLISEKCDVIKIASGDFIFQGISVPSLKTSSKIIASTGGCSTEEIADFVELSNSIRGEVECRESVALLHCVSSYPPPLEESNLKAIPFLNEKTNLTIGFSSHFLEDAPLYGALALGARIFEIHVTDDRGRDDIRDHALSRTPRELGMINSNLNSLNKSLKLDEKTVQPSEVASINLMRKGVIFSRDLVKNHILEINDFYFARPFNPALPPLRELIGVKLSRDVKAFHPAQHDDFEL